MTLVYTSLGQPATVALAVTVAFRGLSLWIPFVIGFACLRRLQSSDPARASKETE